MDFRAERRNRGQTLSEFCREVDISRPTMIRVENGETPSEPVAKKLADYYGVKVTDLWPVDQDSEAAA